MWSVPPELGDLGNLERLYLDGNDLTGPIPPELGNLANLESMVLCCGLTGPMPAELGDLSSLVYLNLEEMDFSGSIPPELGNLGNLGELIVQGANLSGPIPPELGNLGNLWRMDLGGNDLSGPIPAALGNLSTLGFLSLNSNDLSGSLPPELGNLSLLRHLDLADNPALAGPLPSELTALGRLETFFVRDTGLCAPSDPAIRTWLAGVHSSQVSVCDASTVAAYLTQAVQSREFPVPLVAGEKALLRVFPTVPKSTSADIPLVRARFFRDGRETHVANIPGKSTPIPTEVREGDLAKSANTEIPGRVVQPGLEMVIEVDPEGTLDAALEVARRIPAEGRLAVDVREMPLLDLTLIPFVWDATQDSSIVDLVASMEEDPVHHEVLRYVHELLPVGELKVTSHEPVLTSSNNANTLLHQTSAIRAIEEGSGHYMGLLSGAVSGGFSGVAYIGGRSSFALADPHIIAHELGHNFDLLHAPCGGSRNRDPQYPYPDGSIGTWGYDFARQALVRPSTSDLMSYCGPRWIGDYHFNKALGFRLREVSGAQQAVQPSATRSLLVWGGVGADSIPFLEPAFLMDAPSVPPDSGGDYRLAGRTADGRVLFSLSFAMPEVAGGDGSSSFAFVLPARPGWGESLASINLTGPGGSVALNRDTDRPMAILRNPRTGQVRGFLRDVPAAIVPQATADATGSSASAFEVLFSRGIPDAGAWRR